MNIRKVAVAMVVVSAYVLIPAYRYYVLGGYIGYRILSEKQSKYRVIKKGSKLLHLK